MLTGMNLCKGNFKISSKYINRIFWAVINWLDDTLRPPTANPAPERCNSIKAFSTSIISLVGMWACFFPASQTGPQVVGHYVAGGEGTGAGAGV